MSFTSHNKGTLRCFYFISTKLFKRAACGHKLTSHVIDAHRTTVTCSAFSRATAQSWANASDQHECCTCDGQGHNCCTRDCSQKGSSTSVSHHHQHVRCVVSGGITMRETCSGHSHTSHVKTSTRATARSRANAPGLQYTTSMYVV